MLNTWKTMHKQQNPDNQATLTVLQGGGQELCSASGLVAMICVKRACQLDQQNFLICRPAQPAMLKLYGWIQTSK